MNRSHFNILLVIVFLISFGGIRNEIIAGFSLQDVTIDSAYYTCPMHPEIRSDKPGECPKCGMDLVRKESKDSKDLLPQEIAPDTNLQNVVSPEVKPIEKAGHKIEKPGLVSKPKTVRYDLYVSDTTVNFTGKNRYAININGSIPAPTLTFTEGDTAEIYVHNQLDEETSVHWHGVFLPNQFDGVPYLTQLPIKAHETFLYKFPVIQNGTYWYHSHTRLQEQSGMYGVLIFLKRNEPDIPALPVIISDWTDYNPKAVNRWLHNATDWFAIKKGSTQSYSEAISHNHFGTKVGNELKRMNAMDVSDVRYDAFLTNGIKEFEAKKFKVGDKVKLRLINGGASTYFWLTYSGGKITVVGNDGNDVQPVKVDRLLIAPAETYDVIVELPDNMSYEFLATSEDRIGNTSLWLGDGMKMPAERLPKLKYFAGMKMMNAMMDMNGNMLEMEGMQMSNQTMDMNEVMYPEVTGPEKKDANKDPEHSQHKSHGKGETGKPVTLNYAMLKATEKTTLPDGPVREFRFDLTGNMNRYVWTINNRTVSERDKILIKKGEKVRIVLFNNSMMRHPMHLHGHDFRLLNGQGEYAPLKNVLDIMPMETDSIEFAASESGDWFFHCHILYHMMSGMGNIFSYESSPANPEIPEPKIAERKFKKDDRMVHFMTKIGIESNGSDGEAMLGQTRWKLGTMWHLGYHDEHGYESETMLGRYFGKMQWLFPYVGYDYHYKMVEMNDDGHAEVEKTWFGQTSNKNDRKAFMAGVEYTLPMLISADARIDSEGKFRFQLSREDIPVSPRLRLNWMVNSDNEYMAGFRYILTKYFSLSTHYDSDMSYGAGITLTY